VKQSNYVTGQIEGRKNPVQVPPHFRLYYLKSDEVEVGLIAGLDGWLAFV